MKVNKLWHTSHVLPRNATLEERAEWHEAHAKACGCRPIPPSVRLELRRKARLRRSV